MYFKVLKISDIAKNKKLIYLNYECKQFSLNILTKLKIIRDNKLKKPLITKSLRQ